MKGKNAFDFCCFAKPSTACISGTNQPIFMGFSAKFGIKIAQYNYIETINSIHVTLHSLCWIASQMVQKWCHVSPYTKP